LQSKHVTIIETLIRALAATLITTACCCKPITCVRPL